MTKILHILSDKNRGGAGDQVLALIQASNTQDFAMEVLVPENSFVAPLLAKRGITYYEAPHIADRSFSLAGVKALHKLIKQIKPDIVHTHGSLAGRIAARLNRAKVVHTRHSVFPVAAWRKRFPMKQISGLINNVLSNRVIAVSPAAKENLVDLGTAHAKIHTIYNGTPPAQSTTPHETQALKAKYDIPPGTFTLAIMARLTEVKGHDYILDAAKAVPDVLVLIAGKGDRQTHLEERITNENITNARMLGFIEEVDEIVAISDALLNASFGTEASSMALILGMSAGKPAIVSDYGGNPYLVQGGVNGLVFESRDALALAKAIYRLKSSPDLYTQLSQGAIRTYNEKFTDKKMASDTQAVYIQITTR
ncbi:MAG: glycosyltransferase family 4 protein [Defluviitaleaceae bacterium]|nr:glycosyltransferase family 4 protein [Defluviitaleaceae bacterium]